jgi:N6-L-threonylcarbamoyladenine synthase
MRILAIETSCDETSAAIIEGQGKSLKLIKNTVATSINLHKDTGGIIPENAAREQLKYILPVLSETTDDFESLDAIAVTYGPGLIGSLLVGVETAKTLSFVFNKPLIPVNHLIGHVYANWLDQKREIEFPALGLIVSGGHTDLILINDHKKIKWLGGTRDDAAGEAFDKIGRILGLPYPGGPAIEKAAREGNPKAINLPRPMIDSDNFDFSFSGLKAATLRTVQANKLNDKLVSDIAASVQQAIVDVILSKTIKAAKKFKVKSILLGGGVAANSKLRDELEAKNDIPLFTPPKSLCTDNAAMIGAAAYFYFEPRSWQKIEAMPELYFGV